jgi:hypothetical protein
MRVARARNARVSAACGAAHRCDPAWRRGAAATACCRGGGEDGVDIGRVVRLTLDLIVVSELLARLDRAQCFDEHPTALDHRLAVRVAGVIDEARLVAIDACIDDGALIHDEQKSVGVAGILVLVAAVGLGVRDALAHVLDDARALADTARGEHTQPVQRRRAHLDERSLVLGRAAHTATGARIGA